MVSCNPSLFKLCTVEGYVRNHKNCSFTAAEMKLNLHNKITKSLLRNSPTLEDYKTVLWLVCKEKRRNIMDKYKYGQTGYR